MLIAVIIFGLAITVLLIRISNQVWTLNESIIRLNNNFALYVVKKAEGVKAKGLEIAK